MARELHIRVLDKEYPVDWSVKKVSLRNLQILADASTLHGKTAVTPSTINYMLGKFREFGESQAERIEGLKAKLAEAEEKGIELTEADLDVTLDELLEMSALEAEPWFLPNLIGLVFIVRRAAGEDATYADAESIGNDDWSFTGGPEIDDETPQEPELPKDESGAAENSEPQIVHSTD